MSLVADRVLRMRAWPTLLALSTMASALFASEINGARLRAAADHPSTVVIAPAPEGETLSSDYEVTVNGGKLPLYRCRVSAVPLNQVWPGYQRPLDQTEWASFGYWDMSGPVEVCVIAPRKFTSVAIRPRSLGIVPTLSGRELSFVLDRPLHCTVEVDGTHHALQLFASPLEQDPPTPDDPGVRYFGPGVHKAAAIQVRSNQTVYLAPGAVVHGHIVAENAQNIRILGRGILDASTFERMDFPWMVRLVGCRNVVVEGIVLRDPNNWTVVPANCQNVALNNLKLIGLWRYNSDGINVVNSQHVTITNCFIRSFDDSICIKGIKAYDQQPVLDVTVSNCVIWNDWNKAMRVGPCTCAPEIKSIAFRDCDIIRTAGSAVDVHCGDRAQIRGISFERIRLEIDPHPLRPRLQTRRDERYEPDADGSFCPSLLTVAVGKTNYSTDTELGSIRDVRLKDIRVTGPCMPRLHVNRSETKQNIEGVVIEDLQYNGRIIDHQESAPK